VGIEVFIKSSIFETPALFLKGNNEVSRKI